MKKATFLWPKQFNVNKINTLEGYLGDIGQLHHICSFKGFDDVRQPDLIVLKFLTEGLPTQINWIIDLNGGNCIMPLERPSQHIGKMSNFCLPNNASVASLPMKLETPDSWTATHVAILRYMEDVILSPTSSGQKMCIELYTSIFTRLF